MLNKVQLIGNLGKNPEQRVTASGLSVASFSIATSSKRKKDGQTIDDVEWHNIIVFDKLADICTQYLIKGSKVYIDGSIKTEKWQDKETGQDRYSTKIIANQMIMLDSKSENQGQGQQQVKQSTYSDNDDFDVPF